MGTHLTFMGESHCVSIVVAGSFEFLWWDGDFREPLMLPQGHQASFHVARGTLEFLWNSCKGVGFILIWGRKLRPLSSWHSDLEFPIEFIRGARHPTHIEAWNSVSVELFNKCPGRLSS